MSQPNFDRIAHPYRLLESLTLGSALQRCRQHFLPNLLHQRKALVLGDGDGRFLAQLLAQNPHLEAEAVDISPAMLHLLRQNCAASQTRLKTHQTPAQTFQPTGPYDLVVTHFFLDCLPQPELDALISRITPTLAPEALWLVSDFRIPPGLLRLPAKLFVRALYLAFRILTNLRTTRLPNHARALTQAGFALRQHHHLLGGILTTELWQLPPAKADF